jgi:hypothetical protein
MVAMEAQRLMRSRHVILDRDGLLNYETPLRQRSSLIELR